MWAGEVQRWTQLSQAEQEGCLAAAHENAKARELPVRQPNYVLCANDAAAATNYAIVVVAEASVLLSFASTIIATFTACVCCDLLLETRPTYAPSCPASVCVGPPLHWLGVGDGLCFAGRNGGCGPEGDGECGAVAALSRCHPHPQFVEP